MKLQFITLIFVVIGSTFATPYHDEHNSIILNNNLLINPETINFENLWSKKDPGLTAVANKYFDELFKKLGDFILRINGDPTTIPNLGTNFTWFLISGELSFKNGKANGLSTIYRAGQATITYKNKVIDVIIPMKFRSLRFVYDYVAKFMNIGPSGKLDGLIEQLLMEVRFTANVKDLKLKLKKFSFTNTGKLSLTWSGNGLVDWMFNMLTSVTLKFMQSSILGILGFIIKLFINNLLKKINDDIQGIITS